MLLRNLDPWQNEVLNYKGNFLLCTGRQVGKTTIMAMKAGERMIKSPNTRIIICSLTEDQAQLIIVMVLDYLEKNYRAYFRGAKKATKNNVWLNNKSEILARPVGNTGDALRGFTGDVLILDEASRMPELAFLAAKPTLLTTGGEIWICSTPFGKSGYFYESFCNRDNRFKVFHISSEQVIKNRLISEDWTEEKRFKAIRFLEDEAKQMPSLQYAQEYLGLFVDDLRQFFSDELIDKCCTAKRQEKKEGGAYFCGADIARAGEDETALEILEFNNKKLIHYESIVRTKQLTTDTSKEIVTLNRIWKFKRIYIDTGGIGAAVFDQLMQEPSTMNRVEAIDNATRAINNEDGKRRLRKEELYSNLLRLMERGEITLLNDEKVRLSLKSVQYEYKTSDDRQTRMKIFGNYTHIAEGLIRAAWCSATKHLNLWCAWS